VSLYASCIQALKPFSFNQNFLTFNSLNIFILKGDGAQGMELTFASLMARAADEPDALYCLAARAPARAEVRAKSPARRSHSLGGSSSSALGMMAYEDAGEDTHQRRANP
jgi:hypothetical protein